MNTQISAHSHFHSIKPVKLLIILGVLAMGVPLLHAKDGDTAAPKITIDGEVDDWKNIAAAIESAQSPATEDQQEVDVKQLKVAGDEENLYLYFDATASPLTVIEGKSGGMAEGIFVVYLDTDGDATTGCKDHVLIGEKDRKVSGFDLQLVVYAGRDAGSIGALKAKDGPFARYDTFAARNGSFSFRDRKKLEEKYSIYRNPKIALCPMGIELALPLETYGIKPGVKIRLLMHKMGSMKNAVLSEGSYQLAPAD